MEILSIGQKFVGRKGVVMIVTTTPDKYCSLETGESYYEYKEYNCIDSFVHICSEAEMEEKYSSRLINGDSDD